MNVKQPTDDDVEIQSLANKIIESNRKKMLEQPQKLIQKNAFTVLMNKKRKTNPDPGFTALPISKNQLDDDSSKGIFGWESIGGTLIPYITRKGLKYCATRMLEQKVFINYFGCLHSDIFSNCVCVKSCGITEIEAQLLNEINYKHCDGIFGQERFVPGDEIVELFDAKEFHTFLFSCYTKLLSNGSDPAGKSGFIRINGEAVVPFVALNSQRYVPIFYFEGEMENLKKWAKKLQDWDLVYLKFCCTVQGIRNELFDKDSCSVISLNDVKNYFPSNTEFQEFWPKNYMYSQLLNKAGSRNSKKVSWTMQARTGPSPVNPARKPGSFRDFIEKNGLPKGDLTLDEVKNYKLIPIPESSQDNNSQHQPYKMQKVLVEEKLLPCINFRPYVYLELLVTLTDLIEFFNKIPLESCLNAMKALGIGLYKANKCQTQALAEAGKCSKTDDVVLVLVKNVMDSLPHLKYMLAGVLPSMNVAPKHY